MQTTGAAISVSTNVSSNRNTSGATTDAILTHSCSSSSSVVAPISLSAQLGGTSQDQSVTIVTTSVSSPLSALNTTLAPSSSSISIGMQGNTLSIVGEKSEKLNAQTERKSTSRDEKQEYKPPEQMHVLKELIAIFKHRSKNVQQSEGAGKVNKGSGEEKDSKASKYPEEGQTSATGLAEELPTEEIDFSRTVFVFIQHSMESTTLLFDAVCEMDNKRSLVEDEHKYENMFHLGKKYSISEKGHKRLTQQRKKGMNWIEDTTNAENQIEKYGPGYEEKVQELLEAADKFVGARPLNDFDKLIIIDDGAHAILELNKSEKYTNLKKLKIAAVEQTTAGVREIIEQKLKFPVIHIAYSAAKQYFEADFVATAVQRSIKARFHDLLEEKKEVAEGKKDVKDAKKEQVVPETAFGVIGCGPIGIAVAECLRGKGRKVYLYDIKEAATKKWLRENNKEDPGDFVNSLEKLFDKDKKVDYVFGCVGKNTMEDNDNEAAKLVLQKIKERFETEDKKDSQSETKDEKITVTAKTGEEKTVGLKQEICFVSCSSENKEFFALLQELLRETQDSYKKEFLGVCEEKAAGNIPDYVFQLAGCNVRVCRGGYPINFMPPVYSIPSEDVQMLMGLLFTAAIQAYFEAAEILPVGIKIEPKNKAEVSSKDGEAVSQASSSSSSMSSGSANVTPSGSSSSSSHKSSIASNIVEEKEAATAETRVAFYNLHPLFQRLAVKLWLTDQKAKWQYVYPSSLLAIFDDWNEIAIHSSYLEKTDTGELKSMPYWGTAIHAKQGRIIWKCYQANCEYFSFRSFASEYRNLSVDSKEGKEKAKSQGISSSFPTTDPQLASVRASYEKARDYLYSEMYSETPPKSEGQNRSHYLKYYDMKEVYTELLASDRPYETKEGKDLEKFVTGEFLDDRNAKLLLVVGDSGSGKTFFAEHLEEKLWDACRSVSSSSSSSSSSSTSWSAKGYVPIYVHLSTLKDPLCTLQKSSTQLQNFPTVITEIFQNRSISNATQFLEHHPTVLFFDGFDEVHGKSDFYKKNGFAACENLKIVLFCRADYFAANILPTLSIYNKSGSYLVKYLIPFSPELIQTYLQKYVSKKRQHMWDAATYWQYIQQITGLEELVGNPFLLYMTAEVLPDLAAEYESKNLVSVSRTSLYSRFIDKWYLRSFARLLEVGELSSIAPFNLKQTLNEFNQDLAVAQYELTEVHSSVSSLSSSSIASASTSSATSSSLSSSSSSSFASMPNSTSLPNLPQKYEARKKVLLTASPIRPKVSAYSQEAKITNEVNVVIAYEYLHRSFQEYFIAQALCARLGRDQDGLDWNRYLFSFEMGILAFLADWINEADVDEKLFTYVLESKGIQGRNKSVQAANALSSLVVAGVPLSNRDLSLTNAQRSFLSYGIFDCTNFAGANLSGSKMERAWLRKAVLSQADLTNVDFGELLRKEFEHDVNACCYSLDYRYLAVASGNKIFIYDGHTYSALSVLKRDDLDEVKADQCKINCITFSRNNLLASGSEDGAMCLWEVDQKKTTPICVEQKHTRSVDALAFGPDGVLVSGGLDKKLILWDTSQKQLEQKSTLEQHSGEITCIAFGQNGIFVSGSRDKTVCFWDVNAENLIEQINIGSVVNSVAISKKNILAVGHDGYDISEKTYATILLWDISQGQKVKDLCGHASAVKFVMFDFEDLLLSCGFDRSVLVWEVSNSVSKLVNAFYEHTCEVTCVASGPERVLISGSTDRTLRFRNLTQKSIQYRGHTDFVHSLAFNSQGLLASCGGDNAVCLWDIYRRKLLKKSFYHTQPVTKVKFIGDNVLVSESDNRTVSWSVPDMKIIGDYPQKFDYGKNNNLDNLQAVPQGNNISLETSDGKIILDGHKGKVSSVELGPDNLLASGSVDGVVIIWNVKSKEQVDVINGFGGAVTSFAWHKNGDETFLATACKDKSVRVWKAGYKGSNRLEMYLFFAIQQPVLNLLEVKYDDAKLSEANASLFKQNSSHRPITVSDSALDSLDSSNLTDFASTRRVPVWNYLDRNYKGTESHQNFQRSISTALSGWSQANSSSSSSSSSSSNSFEKFRQDRLMPSVLALMRSQKSKIQTNANMQQVTSSGSQANPNTRLAATMVAANLLLYQGARVFGAANGKDNKKEQKNSGPQNGKS